MIDEIKLIEFIKGDDFKNTIIQSNDSLQDILIKLIEEHFELISINYNPPLKFEELHEGMWVWDNNDNKYNKIIEINNDVINFYYVTNSPTRFTCKFEENRFYRYETVEKPEFLKKSMVVKR